MTQFIIANIGSYPRIGEEKDQQRHRRGSANFDNKEISAHAYKDVEQSVVQEVVHEQALAGLDEVTDGLVTWQDPISHFSKNINGIKLGGYDRYFDTNFYFRRPDIRTKPRFKAPVVVSEFEFTQKISAKPVRAVLTGPLTLAAHCTGTAKPYNKLPARLAFFTDVICEEVHALSKAGAKIIQIDEPSLGQTEVDMTALKKHFEKIISCAGSSKIVLASYFSNFSDIYNHVKTWPLSGLQLDFTQDAKKLMEKLVASVPPLEIGLGVINSRTTKLDPIDPILNLVKSFMEKVQPAICRLTPSCGLEFLPRDTALAKIGLLSKLKEELHG